MLIIRNLNLISVQAWTCLDLPANMCQEHSFEGKELSRHFLRKVFKICGLDNLKTLQANKKG